MTKRTETNALATGWGNHCGSQYIKCQAFLHAIFNYMCGRAFGPLNIDDALLGLNVFALPPKNPL